jgi:TatD DNase family protein
MLVDSHCHLDCLDLSAYAGDSTQAIQAAQANDVSHMLCVSIDLENFPKVLAFAEQYANIYASVGVHPNELEARQPQSSELIQLAQHPKVIAIGETGLDYYRTDKDGSTQQQHNFHQHIQAAKTTNKPLIIHMRDAAEDTLHIMRETQAAQVGGVMHCFTETWEVAQRAIELNFCISISGIVTFKNAHTIQEVAQKVPLDRLLIETDAPYLAPVPMRGKPNEPSYLHHTAKFIAELRGISYAELAQATSDNFFKLFFTKQK